jgi:hypothetical protein
MIGGRLRGLSSYPQKTIERMHIDTFPDTCSQPVKGDFKVIGGDNPADRLQARPLAQAVDEPSSELVTVKYSVQITAPDLFRTFHLATAGSIIKVKNRSLRPGRDAMVDLIAVNLFAGELMDTGFPGKVFGSLDHGIHVEITETGQPAIGGFYFIGIVDHLAKHLIAAADADYFAAVFKT